MIPRGRDNAALERHGKRGTTARVSDAIIPQHENLRRAIQWLSSRDCVSRATIEAASVRFDLGPRDEQFLLDHFITDPSDRKSPG